MNQDQCSIFIKVFSVSRKTICCQTCEKFIRQIELKFDPCLTKTA